VGEFWLWAGFATIVAAILAFDLGIVGRQKREIGVREPLLMVGCYSALWQSSLRKGCAGVPRGFTR
jgi:hypothetical protein